MGLFAFLPFLIIILFASIKQVNQYQRGVKFTLGKYTETVQPGLCLILPIIQTLTKVDVRTKVIDVPDQEAITKDNIPAKINAVIYYKVIDSAKALIQVENFYYATSLLAQTTMRNVVGEFTLEDLLKNRDDVAAKIQAIVDKATDPWGIQVDSVELKDIVLPEDLKRTMAKEAESQRERKALVIKSEGEVESAANMVKAAAMLGSTPGALHLRTLQSINDLSSDASNTTIWMIPVEVLRALEGLAEKLKK
ncbi:MAG: SPFH domain-containing protein [Candidatus Peregrinibacteria bacterium GW2011_GWF2_33_10]|nr:MAG: SPFH domain-containing protein [Candidatus Peregrinibacteria bacterium GW2011_GWF2_33_10]OGJ44015.1 MAG: hypothetical protein A2263_01370 [Candidatus Peregrinibacteria bacterium RIFOXYA2_FULL_33_21]OGJ47178.1 MAG: hypothetical protein A2272_05870 [Candidatus Peregrinibacteria bacterium RIFOXYA12_FULL_33_12]OGJ49912.1 MAG: hypothetical protein A2307_00880 [Candidatus Peregrinibacteria bacterium RIFOXYB2_FULL_33_20]